MRAAALEFPTAHARTKCAQNARRYSYKDVRVCLHSVWCTAHAEMPDSRERKRLHMRRADSCAAA